MPVLISDDFIDGVRCYSFIYIMFNLYVVATDGLTDSEKEMYELALSFARKEMAPNMMNWDLQVRTFLVLRSHAYPDFAEFLS